MNMNERDFDSPGFEYLRLYQNMSNLYYKLIALNYQKEFCSLYRCPPIHKCYFSQKSENFSEQQFIFTCLCAWLIKDKCQMNFNLEPEEYQDPESVIDVIFEALELLVMAYEDNETPAVAVKGKERIIKFSPGKLRSGYGPEVVWALNVLADRGLEVMFEFSGEHEKSQMIFKNSNIELSSKANDNYIVVGQPFVGGGLTTRPLGSYQIDDKSLLFESGDSDSVTEKVNLHEQLTDLYLSCRTNADADQWYQQVRSASQLLELNQKTQEQENENISLSNFSFRFKKSLESIEEFLNQCKALLVALTFRIDKQMQIIKEKEQHFQEDLRDEIKSFLENWMLYTSELTRHNELLAKVEEKTDRFESYVEETKNFQVQTELRIRDMNDESKLDDLKLIIDNLTKENSDFNLKIGLLLSEYWQRQSLQ